MLHCMCLRRRNVSTTSLADPVEDWKGRMLPFNYFRETLYSARDDTNRSRRFFIFILLCVIEGA